MEDSAMIQLAVIVGVIVSAIIIIPIILMAGGDHGPDVDSSEE